MVYDWKRNMPVKAQDVGKHFEHLEQKHGKVTPKIVLESARSESSLLHPCFEWVDEIAAEKYREQQAGFIIRNLTVKVETDTVPEQTTCVRAFVNIKTNTESEFLSITKVLQDDELRIQMLTSAKKELQAFKDKYSNLEELAGVFDAITNFERIAG